jgi:hypothetical protein
MEAAAKTVSRRSNAAVVSGMWPGGGGSVTYKPYDVTIRSC